MPQAQTAEQQTSQWKKRHRTQTTAITKLQ